MPLTGGNRRSRMLLKINDHQVSLNMRIEDGLGGSRGNVGRYLKKGANRIAISSAPGTGLKHGLQRVIIKYFRKSKPTYGPRLPIKVPKKHTKIGSGWNMYTSVEIVRVGDEVNIKGITDLTNYNDILGFTGGVVVKIKDDQGRILHTRT